MFSWLYTIDKYLVCSWVKGTTYSKCFYYSLISCLKSKDTYSPKIYHSDGLLCVFLFRGRQHTPWFLVAVLLCFLIKFMYSTYVNLNFKCLMHIFSFSFANLKFYFRFSSSQLSFLMLSLSRLGHLESQILQIKTLIPKDVS